MPGKEKVPYKPADYLEPDIVDRYEWQDLLGMGSFGHVYRVKNKATGGEFAMKIMSYAQLGPKGVEQVKGEIEAMQMLPPHPRILQLHDVFYSKTGVAMLLDVVRGGELFKHLLKMKHYSERTAALITRNLLQAISHMHSFGIVHRDLKPDNMLLLQETADTDRELSSIIVSDFGFAVPYRGAQLTQPCGTPYYLAPEILDVGLYKNRASYDQQCDVWSIGVIAYVLLVGYPPFNGSDKNKLFKAIDQARPDFTNKAWNGISPVAIDFIKFLLKRNSTERPSARDALNHPWIQSVSAVPDLHLADSQTELAKFANQKLKGAFFGVEAILRLQYLAACNKSNVRGNSNVLEVLAAASQPVKTLTLRGNYLGPKGVEALVQALVNNSNVESLDMSNTLIEDDTAEVLFDHLQAPPSKIRHLLLDENPVTHGVGRRILTLLQKGTGPLKYVSVNRTHISDALQRKIREASAPEKAAAIAALGEIAAKNAEGSPPSSAATGISKAVAASAAAKSGP